MGGNQRLHAKCSSKGKLDMFFEVLCREGTGIEINAGTLAKKGALGWSLKKDLSGWLNKTLDIKKNLEYY